MVDFKASAEPAILRFDASVSLDGKFFLQHREQVLDLMHTDDCEGIFVVAIDIVLEKSLFVLLQDICDILVVVLVVDWVDCLVDCDGILTFKLFVFGRFESLGGLPESLLILAITYVTLYFRYLHIVVGTSLLFVEVFVGLTGILFAEYFIGVAVLPFVYC